jgi:nucleotide-binding universal stress UspA family protein
MIRTRIVVGVDGSAGSTAALRWAAAWAGQRDAEVRVLTAYHRQHPGQLFGAAPERPAVDEKATAVLHAAVTEARSIAPDTEVRGMALPGYAVPMLLHAAEGAALLVVGDRANRGMPGLPFGSVSSQVATHARCSVVVVRGRSGAEAGPVVVGVDDGPAAGRIMGRAFEEAALGGAPLVAVTAGSAPGDDVDGGLDPWRRRYPSVTAEHEVVAGRPDRVLTQRSQQARLVVVGPRRHGFEGVLLGAVGTRLLQHADCPVLIART